MRSRSSRRLGEARRGRAIAGLVGLLVALGYSHQAWTTLPLGRQSQPGAAVFSLLVGVLMAASSLMILVEEMGSSEAEEERLAFPDRVGRRRLLGVVASLLGYVALASLAGHLLGSVVLSVAMVHLIKPGSWLRTAIVGLAISLSAYALFVLLLGVPLPKGSLW